MSENVHFNALSMCTQLNLTHVCDTKVAGDESYFKLNPAKLLAWLKTRVERVLRTLSTRNIAGSNTASNQ